MRIDDIDTYKESLGRLLNNFIEFEETLQDGQANEQVMDFIRRN